MKRFFFLWVILPLLPLALWSLAAGWRWPSLLPAAWSVRAWHYLFSPGAGLAEAVTTSLGIALLVTIITIILGVPAGKALSSFHFPGKRLVEFLFYLPILVPASTAAMALQPFFIRLGLIDTITGVVLVHLIPTLPYLIRAASVGFSTVNPLLVEQARSLGATPWQSWRSAVLPALAPALTAGAGLVFLISLSQYLLTLLIGSDRVLTLPLLLLPFASGGDRSIGAALSLIFTLPGLMVFGLMDVWLRRKRLEVTL